MHSISPLCFLFTFFCMLLPPPASSLLELKLERAFPNHGSMQQLSLHRLHDFDRHRRKFSPPGVNHVINFSLQGSFNPFESGIYYTTLILGSPPREFRVQIDTGSDITWISCVSCSGCPVTSVLPVQLSYFDPGTSSTSSLISCSDRRCGSLIQSRDATCNVVNNRCSYRVQYEDGDTTTGYFISDMMHFTSLSKGSTMTSSSAPLFFGCSNLRTSSLSRFDSAVDGIFGLGHHALSIISQLYSQGIAPGVFSHCLKGDKWGGGTLVLGEVVVPNITYTSLDISQPHYNVHLQSISVNGQMLRINPGVFSSAMIDSGTSLAYLPEEAYNSFADAIAIGIPKSAHVVPYEGDNCYLTNISVADIFPPASLNFADGASLALRPQDYLIRGDLVSNGQLWCLGFQKSRELTILGDLILKDKIVVYDLMAKRIGWTDYDCSLPFNVNASVDKFKNAGELSGRSHKLKKIGVLAFLLHILI